MNKGEPKAMREIHEIRERLYEEERDLSDKELIAKIHRESDECIKKYGLRIKMAEKVN